MHPKPIPPNHMRLKQKDPLRMKMKKSSPSSLSHASSIITRVFPASWVSRFKQKGSSNPETHHSVNKKQRGKLDFPSSYSIMTPSWREGKFCGFHDADDNDDGAYWRFSFYGDRIEGSCSTGGNGLEMTSLWYNSEEESGAGMVSDIMRMKEKQNYHYKGSDGFTREKSKRKAQFSALRKKEKNGRRSRKLSRGLVKEREAELSLEPERHSSATETEKMDKKAESPDSRSQQNVSFSNSSPCSAEEGMKIYESTPTPEESILGNQFEDKKFKAARIKSHTRRQSSGKKVKQIGEKAYSPQKEFRIRVLDDKKKARMKSKERKSHSGTIFHSFAVIKTSTNPWQDFRDSMIEMINEKGINRPEELEELLASYLTLNCDGQHDLIIKVFLEVCIELQKNAE